jgi:hypothetical protein
MAKKSKQEKTDRPISVSVHNGVISVTLADGRVIENPLEWHSWLAQATPEQQANYELYPFSIDWPDLDEGLDIEGMIRGIPSYPIQSEQATINVQTDTEAMPVNITFLQDAKNDEGTAFFISQLKKSRPQPNYAAAGTITYPEKKVI